MILFLITAVFSFIGALYYNKKNADFDRCGYYTDAEVLSKKTARYKAGRSYVTRYVFDIAYTDGNGVFCEGVFSTTNRRARRLKESDTVTVAVMDSEIMLREDLPGKAGRFFLLLVSVLSLGLFILGIALEFV